MALTLAVVMVVAVVRVEVVMRVVEVLLQHLAVLLLSLARKWMYMLLASSLEVSTIQKMMAWEFVMSILPLMYWPTDPSLEGRCCN